MDGKRQSDEECGFLYGVEAGGMSGEGGGDCGEDNKGRLSPLLSFRGSTVFLDLHNEQRIREAFAREDIYFAAVQGEIVGTGSIRGNEICRLFILPEYQAKGYGSRLMDLLEDMVFQQYQAVHIDASFPAESMYLKRGYRIKTYEKIKTGGGDYLCYHTMEKVAGGKG